MAQRTIHYLFGEIISKEIMLSDKKRFLLGSLLPDAIDPAFRNASHFKIKTTMHKYYDFEAFRNQYLPLMLHDDLYLGYYMHLVEDAFYRTFFYTDRFTMPRTREEIPALHNDYHLLNSYIIQKYHMQNILGNSFSLENEPLSRIAPFTIDTFLSDLADDFTEQPKGNTVFLTESMLDEYVTTYVPLAIKEVNSIKNGGSSLRAINYTWPAKR